MTDDQNPTERRALEMIANGTPALFFSGNVERSCSLCAAHIGVARQALGWQPLPSEGGVPLIEQAAP
jgi:hypothetical protein